jgi:hypothetical protein
VAFGGLMADDNLIPVDHDPFAEEQHAMDVMRQATSAMGLLVSRLDGTQRELAMAFHEMAQELAKQTKAMTRLCKVMEAPRDIVRDNRGKIIGTEVSRQQEH